MVLLATALPERRPGLVTDGNTAQSTSHLQKLRAF